MKIIVTGATGLIGRRLTRELLADGHEIEAWTRSRAAAGVLPARCRIAEWDPRRVDPARIDGVDAVIHLAGENVAGGRWTENRKRGLEDSRVASTEAIVAAIATLPKGRRPKCLLSASAIGIYGDRGDELLPERAGPGAGFMADLCAAWERAVRRAEPHGVRTASLRIGIVLDPEDGMLSAVLPLFRCGLGGRIGTGRQWMSWIHLDDVVGLFRHALENEDLSGPINAAAPSPVRNSEFTAVLARLVGRRALLPVPKPALRLALGEMSAILTDSQRLVPGVATDSGFVFRYPVLSEALGEICSRDGHQLIVEQWLDVPLEQTFSFFADARNLEKITPDFLHFAILSMPDAGRIESGSLIEYRLRLYGLPVRWRTRIQSWDPPHRFVDLQERGPYSLWHHAHEFESVDGGTLVRDRVSYRLPFGGLGDLVAGSWVRRDLERIFLYRREQIQHLLCSRARAA